MARISDRFRKTSLGVLRVAFLSALVLEFLATISTALVAVTVALRLVYARIPYEEALFLLLLAPEFYLPLRLLGTHFHAGMAGASAAGRIFEILETPLPQKRSCGEVHLAPGCMWLLKGCTIPIVIKNIPPWKIFLLTWHPGNGWPWSGPAGRGRAP